ncbi:hypothetical protein GCM10022200_22950 [Microbacterium awajiense]|uniref:Uncharacterized protein n=1 Tax=Microbacterium awajiense TaxID=415214 RepID=A0ABP7AS37_9MICO
MSTTAIRHPLLDGAGPGWAATETRADVVALTSGMSDFLARTATGGDRPIVVSGDHARMTRPLADALSSVRGRWVVRTADDGCYDARTGRRLARPEDVLEVDGIPRTADAHPAFARSGITTRLQLAATVSTRHRVSRPVRLGGVIEAAATRFAGTAPTAWGATEPLVAPWDRDDLTERTRRRMPRDSRWAAVAASDHPLIGTLHVARTVEGLEETTRVHADVAGARDDAAADLGERARLFLADAAAVGMPLMGVAMAALGSDDLARRCTGTPPPEPLALMIGPPGVRALGSPVDRWADELGAALVGSPRLPGLLLPLGSVEGGGWRRLDEVLAAFGPDRVAELLAVAPAAAAQLGRGPRAGRDD